MSSGLTVGIWKFRQALSAIVPLFPSGTHVVPVLFRLSNEDLLLVCTSGCVYSDTLTVSNPDNENWEVTVMYKNLLDVLPTDGQLNIMYTSFGIELVGGSCTVQLPKGYSIITPPKFPDSGYTRIPESSLFRNGLRTLVGMGLGSLYLQDKPVHLYGQVALLKYPNVQVQVRVPGLDMYMMLAPEHVKMLSGFNPSEWYTNGVDTLILKRDGAYLEMPMEPLHEENHFVELLNGMSVPVTLDLEHYLDKLRSMSKANPRGRCKLVIREKGLTTSVSQDNITIETTIGDIGSKVINAVYIPMPLWLTMVKAAGSNMAQILYQGDVICLRTNAIIIVAHALV
ncbi:MAG: hypothetical protein NC548_30740 [Lachnospiraceae bacterium]|nr:hypothetical protein [Lachnospiraceae bacterium]